MSNENPERRQWRARRSVAAAALGAALLGSLAVATTAGATHQTGGTPGATAHNGNISQCPNGTTTLLYAPDGRNSSGSGVTATVTNLDNAPTKGGQYLTVDFAPSLNGAVVTVYVKGAKAYNEYGFTVTGTVTGLHAPANKNDAIPAVSHYLICQNEAPPPPPPLLDVPPDIQLGYADDLHMADQTRLAYRPSPWKGDPGVVYVGCEGAECGGDGKFDSGAIRVLNSDTDAPLTLTDATVDIGPCHFDIWDLQLPATATPGGSIVLTQTGVNSGVPMPGPCNLALDPLYWDQTNFDTSERPGDTRDPKHYDCAPATRHVPVIKLTLGDGTVLTINDTTMILNTGGTDSFACAAVDEVAPWTSVPYTP